MAEVLDPEKLAESRECQRPGETDFVTDLLIVFVSDLTVRLQTVRAALGRGDLRAVRDAADSLKVRPARSARAAWAQSASRSRSAVRPMEAPPSSRYSTTFDREANLLRDALGMQINAARFRARRPKLN